MFVESDEILTLRVLSLPSLEGFTLPKAEGIDLFSFSFLARVLLQSSHQVLSFEALYLSRFPWVVDLRERVKPLVLNLARNDPSLLADLLAADDSRYDPELAFNGHCKVLSWCDIEILYHTNESAVLTHLLKNRRLKHAPDVFLERASYAWASGTFVSSWDRAFVACATRRPLKRMHPRFVSTFNPIAFSLMVAAEGCDLETAGVLAKNWEGSFDELIAASRDLGPDR